MGTILGDLFKNVGTGLGKVFDGDIVDGLGDVVECKDLDPELVALVNEKSVQINQAYETIKAARR